MPLISFFFLYRDKRCPLPLHQGELIPNIISITSSTFCYNASKEWSSLTEEDLMAIENKTSFKWDLKKYLFIRAEQEDLLNNVFY